MKKIIEILFIAIFSIMIVGIPLYWLTSGADNTEYSQIEQRNNSTFPEFSIKKFRTATKLLLIGETKKARNTFFNQIINSTFQQKVEQAAIDQFPFRLESLNVIRLMERGMIRMTYSFTKFPTIPADTKTGLYVMRDGSALIRPPVAFSMQTEKEIDKRLENYQILVNKFPEIRFYGYYHQLIQFSPFHPLSEFYWNADNGQSINYFLAHKPSEMTVAVFLLSSYQAFRDNYFATDHHWNIHGAWTAYEGIYAMLSRDYEGIGPKLEIKEFVTFPGLSFLGSNAKKTVYPINPEQIEIVDIELPAHEVLINGKLSEASQMAEYLAGNYSRDPYVNHYGQLFGQNYALVEYIYDKPGGRNLMVFGSSYQKPLEPWLASHYHHTYFVDLRKYDDFSLGDFLTEHEVDDVLVIGENTVLLTGSNWKINP